MTTELPHLPHSPRSGEFFEVEITGLSLKGEGTADYPAYVGPQRQVKPFVFCVRKALPGDRVRVCVETRRKRRVIGRIDELLEPSRMRIEPRCAHFGRRETPGKGCGGCTLQNLDYRHQLLNKERLVKYAMADAGVDPGLVAPVMGQEDPWYYRNKMEFSFGDDAQRRFSLGLYPRGYRYEVLNLTECLLQSRFVSTLLTRIRRWAIDQQLRPYDSRSGEGFLRTLTIREGKRTGERLLELTTSHHPTVQVRGQETPAEQVAGAFARFVVDLAEELDGAITSVYWTQQRAVRGEPTRFIEHHLHGLEVLHERLSLPDDHSLLFDIHPRAFFQPNTRQAEVLYATVLDMSGLRDANASHTVLDLYCGTGTIGLCMAPYARKVLGVELQPDAVENARENARRNAITNARFFAGDVGETLHDVEFERAAGQVDVVVVDPPRAGLLPDARAHLAGLDAPRMVYVSCNPITLARDLRELKDQGWHVEAIQPVDMFPHTYHIENVARLRK